MEKIAKRIEGITVEIGGNTTGLNKALAGVNKEIGNTQSQLKDVERLLKLDPKNTELLRQKQELLASTVSQTKDKLTSLKDAEKQAQEQFKDGKVSQQQYNGLKREIEATAQQLETLETQAGKSNVALSQIGTAAGSISSGAGKVAKATAPATLAIGGLATVAFNAASHMAESQNKVSVVFGESADAVSDFAEKSLESFGLAEGTALDMAAMYGDMGTSMGLSQSAAAKMSTSLTGLAGDMASFKDIGVEQAATALNGVFTGETESLKLLGVVMTQTNLLQFAVKEGFIDTAKSAEELEKQQVILENTQNKYNEAVKKHGVNSLEARTASVKMGEAEAKLNESAKATLDTLTEAEKINLRYEYVLNSTTNAQGDAARTAEGAANSTKRMGESTKQAAAEFGQVLLPVITPIIQKITELIQWFGALDDGTKQTVVTILALVAAISPIAGIISAIAGAMAFLAANPIVLIIIGIVAAVAALIAIFMALWNNCEWFRDFFIAMWEGIKAAFSATVAWFQVAIPAIGDFFIKLWEDIKNAFFAAVEWIGGAITSIGEFFSNLWGGIVEGAKWCLNFLINGINLLISNALLPLNLLIAAANLIPGINIPKLEFAIPNIPMMAKGGTLLNGSAIVGEAGPELITVSNGNAHVQPLSNDRMRPAGNTIEMHNTFYGYKPSDGAACVRDLNRQLGRLYT